MDNNMEQAIADISVIRQVMERSRNDFSKVASFFIWIGLINAADILLGWGTSMIRAQTGYLPLISVMAIGREIIKLTAYLLVFLYYRKRMNRTDNEINIGILNMWGVILFGSYIFNQLFSMLLSGVSVESELDYAREMVLYQSRGVFRFIAIIIGCFMLGVFLKKPTITFASALVTAVYLALFAQGVEIPVAKLGDSYLRSYASEVFVILILSLGMILLGIYLKKENRRETYGTSLDT